MVIIGVNDYVRETKCQLNDSKNYKVLAKDPTATNNGLVNQTTCRFIKEQLINENITNGFKYPSPITPQFYISPKIHKERHPGNPVVSSLNSHMKEILIPSYVKNTNDFINKINTVKSVPKYNYLVAIHVRSLYTNTPNAQGTSAVKRAFDNYSKKTTTSKVIATFFALILTLNNLVFDCIHYLQRKGCAMGTICAPAYPNIFMANFELNSIYLYIKNKTKMFLRFLDDLFMIWAGSEQELLDSMSDLNKKHPSIKFEFEHLQIKIEVLDVIVYKDQNNILQTTIYRKESDRENYLDAQLEYPKLLKGSIPYSHALWIK